MNGQGDSNQNGGSYSPFDNQPSMLEGASKTAHIFVSLYLILIAFFIVMHTISHQEVARAGAVMDSVNTAFRKQHLPRVEVLDLLADRELDSHADDFYQEVDSLFAGLIDFPGKLAAQGRDRIVGEFPSAVLYPHREINIRPDQTRFLNALADLVKREAVNEHREVEIVVAAPPWVLGDDALWRNPYVQRAAAFARELEDRGVPGRSIATGVVVDDRDMVWLSFSSRTRELMDSDRSGEL